MKESCLKKINNICYGIVSIISAIGLTCSFTIAPEKISGAGLEEYSQIVRFFIYCINILSGDRLITLALIIFYFCILRKINSLKSTKIEKILAGIFALLFAFMQVLGKSYASNNSWDAVFMSKFVFLRACAYGMAVGILIYGVVLYLFKKIDAILHENNDKGNSISIVKLAMMFFICWLPYFAVFYPGTGNGDTASQIMQYHHIYTAILKLSSLQGESIFASNHHPYFLTLVFGIFSKIGLWLGNIDYGIAIYVILQMLLFAFTLAYMWKYLQELGTTFKYIRFGIIFMAIVPIVPLHSICMVKDTLFSICCLVLTLHLTEIIRYDGEKLKEFKFCLLLFITCVLFALTKNQGVYFLIVLFTVFLFTFRRYWKNIILTMLIPILFFTIIWSKILLPYMNVAPGGLQEAIGFMFQQTARYIVEYPEDVTEEEKDVIRNVIDYDSLNELYNPTLHDPVKYTYNQHSTKEEITEYFKVWLKMLIRHPDSYIQATLNSTLGGFYMEKNSSWVYYKFDNRVKMDSNLYVSNNEETAIFFQKLISLLQKIPGINVFFTLALYVWISVFFFFEQIRQRKYKYMLCGVISLLSVLLLFICPANGNFRYIMPIFYICFFEVGICCADKIKGGK